MSEYYQTIKLHIDGPICRLQIYRPDNNNTINHLLILEMTNAIEKYQSEINVLVLEGLPEVFCFGADFNIIGDSTESIYGVSGHATNKELEPEALYDLWLKLATGPFISIAHVRGKANAGGVGFVAACDIAIADENAVFSLSELLFGLMPACVLPFLICRTGAQKAHYMTLMTQAVNVAQAREWGLVDAFDKNSESLLRRHILRLRRLPKIAIIRYKKYINSLNNILDESKLLALEANLEVFNDKSNLEKISRYTEFGVYPWEN